VPSCKSEMCSVHNTGGLADATKVCYDHSIGISLSPENPPPLFLCQECASRLQSEQPGAIEHMNDVAYPISRTGTTCDNKVKSRKTLYPTFHACIFKSQMLLL